MFQQSLEACWHPTSLYRSQDLGVKFHQSSQQYRVLLLLRVRPNISKGDAFFGWNTQARMILCTVSIGKYCMSESASKRISKNKSSYMAITIFSRLSLALLELMRGLRVECWYVESLRNESWCPVKKIRLGNSSGEALT